MKTITLFSLLLPLSSYAGFIADNIRTVVPQMEEHCEEAVVVRPDSKIVLKHGRLIQELRNAAKAANPVKNLLTAEAFYNKGDVVMGNAYADLSVTGQKSYERFKALHAKNELPQGRALDRAYKVANVLPFTHSPDRAALGYIAVSGEDDQPTRPVNVPGTEYPQYDLDVQVGNHKVRTRFIIAETFKEAPAAPVAQGHTLPKPLVPSLSANARVLIYVHGMDSRLEEGMDIFKSLQKIGKQTGENWTLITMDLPTSGYADKLDHLEISPLSDLGKPRAFPPGFNANGRQNVPIVDFMEAFVVNFVETLDKQVSLKGKIEAVVGGSLGGNLTFRLGRRQDLPWLKSIITWSPASIWDGLADGHDMFKQLAVATAWKRAGGKAKELTETLDKRSAFFNQAFGGAISIAFIKIVPAQPDQWWRRSWACFKNARETSEYERYEIYNENFRRWHWRLGGEQLIFSQQKAPNLAWPRYLDNHVNMLLACGSEDDFRYTNICSATKKTARKMISTPGEALIIKNTGHSIHNERPNFFAAEMVRFLTKKP